LLEAEPAKAQSFRPMTQDPDNSLHEPNSAPPRAGRVLQSLLIIAIVVLIGVALVSFR
jgi:hypothetical protein